MNTQTSPWFRVFLPFTHGVTEEAEWQSALYGRPPHGA